MLHHRFFQPLRDAGQRHAVNYLQHQVNLGRVAHVPEVERVARDGFEAGLALFEQQSQPARMFSVPSCLVVTKKVPASFEYDLFDDVLRRFRGNTGHLHVALVDEVDRNDATVAEHQL
ncbi:uncharacterized protein LOC119770691 [Culex quinquefasciatus]|uniref:uncharacterized protein LOC119770691 n=1 Tax=Culex quinquefasciatus TaxID=7176 RepID=UPI0018E30D8C|nr:uncharacterized protein LOC119770691 [Culex quinquefasciatus]